MKAALPILSILLVFGLCPTAAPAAGPGLSPATYESLQRVDELLSADRPASALRELESVYARLGKGDDYDRAQVLRSFGYVHAGLEDYRTAEDHLERSLATGALPAEHARRVLFDLGHLYQATGEYGKAVERLEEWIAQAQEPTAEAWLRLGQAYLQWNRPRKALPALRKAVALAKRPDESWYRLLLSVHYELGQNRECIRLLETMVRLFPPNKLYWQQLAAIHLNGGREHEALAALEVAYREGLLTDGRDILELASLCLALDLPYRSARLLAREMDAGRVKRSARNLERLADAWLRAREAEMAAVALEAAAAHPGSGDLYLRLGRLYVDRHQWGSAAPALEQALARDELEDRGNTSLLLGLAYRELGHADRARRSFIRALEYENSRGSAEQWLALLDTAS